MKTLFNTLFLLSIISFVYSCTPKTKEAAQDDKTTQAKKEQSARPAHWGYEGNVGPTNWASLDPVYSKCGNGMHQSPINISKTDVKGGVTWNLDYKVIPSFMIEHTEHMEEIVDNGHTIQVNVDPGSTFTFGGETYELKQFHFHTPSEHTIDGKNMPMEMHMVHQSADKSLAVISLLFEEGSQDNPNFAPIIDNLPNAKGEKTHVTEALNIKNTIPRDNYAYHYIGSLTTPPCSENVQWLVLRDPATVSKAQIAAISARIGKNNRPTQDLNDRTVKMDDLTVDAK